MNTTRTTGLFLALVLPGPAQDLARPGADLRQSDRSKSIVERPLEDALRPAAGPRAAAGPTASTGRVAWHASFDAALAAASRSGKPVLLFQLLGRLDDEFC